MADLAKVMTLSFVSQFGVFLCVGMVPTCQPHQMQIYSITQCSMQTADCGCSFANHLAAVNNLNLFPFLLLSATILLCG